MRESLRSFPVTALLGPRQCGKFTLARHVVAGRADTVYLDLEKPSDLRKLEDAEFFFHTQKGKLVCIDEVQMGPELFPIIRIAVDEDRRPGKFFNNPNAANDEHFFHLPGHKDQSSKDITLNSENSNFKFQYDTWLYFRVNSGAISLNC